MSHLEASEDVGAKVERHVWIIALASCKILCCSVE